MRTSILAFAILLFASVFAGRLYLQLKFGPPATITDVNRYPELRSSWSDLAAHFPPVLPAAATNIKMSHYPGYMQGGASFQLRVTLPASEISGLDLKYSKIATHTFFGGDTNDHSVPTTFDYTNGTDLTSFSESFKIYVIHAKDEGELGFSWNHGTNGGVAVSGEKNQIVYWCESW